MRDVLGWRKKFGVLGPSTNTIVQPDFEMMRPPGVLRETLIELDGNGRDVDAIVQVGTNLSMVRLAAAAEMWLGKPVIAINTATYWHALRACGIKDRIEGFGRLLEKF